MPLKRRQRIYKKGSTGNDVKRLQYALKLKPDGIFGNNTEATLMLSKGIKEATQKQLDEIVSGTTSEHINIANSYVGKIKELDIEMIAPQHGAVLKEKEHIEAFKTWFKNLQCGTDLMG